MTTSNYLDADPALSVATALLCALLVMTTGCDKGGRGDKTGPAEQTAGSDEAAKPAAAGAAGPCAGVLVTDGLPAGARLGIDVGRPVLALSFAPDGALLATGDAQGEVCLRDPGGKKGSTGRRLGAHEGPVTALAFMPDGKRLVSAGADGTLRVWDAEAGRLLHTIDQAPAGKRRGQPPAGHTPAALLCLAAAPQGDVVATGGWDGRVRLWSATSGKLVRDVATLPFAVVDIAFAPDSTFMAVATEAELEAHLFDTSTGKRVSRAAGYVDPPIGLAFAEGGARLVSVDQKGNILAFARDEPGVYDVAHPAPGGIAGPARTMALTPDGMTVLVGSQNDIVVAGAAGGHKGARVVLAGHSAPVEALAVAPDGRTAGSAGQDGRVLLWSLDAAPAAGGSAGPGDGGSAGQKRGPIVDAYRALVDSGCDPKRAGVATPIEARILRNVPFALAGKPFESRELARLYSSDGAWYRASADSKVELAGADAACVAALKKHEHSLRKSVKLDPRVEAVLIGSPEIFRGLRALGIPGLRLGQGEQRSTEDQTYWVAPCNKGCQEVEMLCDVDPGTGAVTCRVSRQ